MSATTIGTPKAPTLAERLDSLPLSGWHALLMTICSLGVVFDGFDGTILSVALPQLAPAWKLTSVQIGMLGSGSFIGMLVGALFFGTIADRIGRLKVFVITLLTYAVFTGTCALSGGFASMFILRIVVGLGLGGLVPVDSSYLTEYLPSQYRGRFMAWFNGFFSIGNTCCYFVGWLVVVPFGWKWGFVIGIIPALLVAFIQRYLPESTRYLIAKNNIGEAVLTVEKLEKRVLGRITVPRAQAIHEQEQVPAARAGRVPIAELFRSGCARTTIVISILWFAMNYSGYAVIVWLPILLTKQLGYSLHRGFEYIAIGSLISCIGHFSAGFAADYFGRKPTITYSLVLFGVSTYLLFWFGKNPSLGSTLLTVMLIFIGSSWASIYAFSPESFPTAMRGTGMGFAGAVGRLGGILGPTFVGLIYATAGVKWVVHVNMLVLLFAVAVLLVFGRETRNKTLEEIETLTRARSIGMASIHRENAV